MTIYGYGKTTLTFVAALICMIWIPGAVHAAEPMISSGLYHTLALKSNGNVWAWGYNKNGQLGDGTGNTRVTPVPVTTLSEITSLAAKWEHSLALKSDGIVWAWGYNGYGQLGNGTTSNKSIPVQVEKLEGVVVVAAGGFHSLALKSNGYIWAWGFNGYGQLGDGSTENSLTPIQISGLSDITAVDGGEYYSLALKSDGTVWAWGFNGYWSTRRRDNGKSFNAYPNFRIVRYNRPVGEFLTFCRRYFGRRFMDLGKQ